MSTKRMMRLSWSADQSGLDQRSVEDHRRSHYRRRSERRGPARRSVGGVLRYLQSGLARSYVAVVVLGALLLIGYFIVMAVKLPSARGSQSLPVAREAEARNSGGRGGPPIQVEMGEYILTIIILLPLAGALPLLLVGRGDKAQRERAQMDGASLLSATFAVSLALPIGFNKGARASI